MSRAQPLLTSAAAVVAAAVSAYACRLAAVHTTPIDDALPLVAVLVAVMAFLTRGSILLAVPALIAAEIAVRDETLRLLAFGVILAAVFWAAVHLAESRLARLAVPLAAVVLLRWIPLGDVLIGRELLLLAIAAAIVVVLGATPFAQAVAVLTALITPAVPLRTLALPLAVLVVAALARFFGMPRVRLVWPSAAAMAFLILFFAWSGVVARAFPYFLKDAQPARELAVVNYALVPGEAATLTVPDQARALIVSGANVPRLRRGALLGRVDPGGAAVRIGDAADWGYMRRDHFYGSRNPLPRDPAGQVRGYGYGAWVDGAGRVPLPPGARTITITADASLPDDAALQVLGFEIVRR